MPERGIRNRVGEILGEDDPPASRSGAMERWLAPTTESRVEQVPVDAIDEAPWRPAGDDDPTAYRALKASVRASGILQPLVLRRVSDDRLQVVSGARRLRAARETAQSTVPALIRDLSDMEAVMGGWDAVLRAGITAAERDRITADLTGAGMAPADVAALVGTVPVRDAGSETALAEPAVESGPASAVADPEAGATAVEPAPPAVGEPPVDAEAVAAAAVVVEPEPKPEPEPEPEPAVGVVDAPDGATATEPEAVVGADAEAAAAAVAAVAEPEAMVAGVEPPAAVAEPETVVAEVEPPAAVAEPETVVAEAEPPAAVAEPEAVITDSEPDAAVAEPEAVAAEVEQPAVSGAEAADPAGAAAAPAAEVAPAPDESDAPLSAAGVVVAEAASDGSTVAVTPADGTAAPAAEPEPAETAEDATAPQPEPAAAVDAPVIGEAPPGDASDGAGTESALDAEEATETLVGTLPVVMPEEDVAPREEVEWREAVVAALADEERLEPEGLVAAEEPAAAAPQGEVGAATVETPEPAEETGAPASTGRRRAAAAPTVIPIDLPSQAPEAPDAGVGAPVSAPLGAGQEAWSPRVAAATSLPSEPVTGDVVGGARGGGGGVGRLLADPRTYATAGVFLVVWAVVFIIVSVLLGAGGGRPLVAAAVVAVVGILATMGGLAMPRRGL